MVEFNDIALVTQVAVFRNKKAFDQLVRKYQSPVRRFFLNQTLGDEQLSDDLAQETFIKAYVNITKFRGMASFSTWLMRIAYNVFYDEVRKRKVETVSFEEGGRRKEEGDYSHPQIYRQNSSLQQDYSPSSFLVPPSSLKMDIHHALALLKPDERTCITLQLIDGYPIDQIAKITGIAENTVKSHLRRGKEKMANYLKQNGYDR
ncbi:MAG: RNA polymerase sigma factor [Prevotella sp.]|nr:RNA polymerase sigma factor [Prevotella sp.]